MKIKLKYDIPVGKEHGLTEGRIMEVTMMDNGDGTRGSRFVKVMGDVGEEVVLHSHEFETIENGGSVNG